MPKRMLILGVLALPLLGCGGGQKLPDDPSDQVSNDDDPKGAIAVGMAAPEVEGEVLGGLGPRTLADARGQVVIVDFWATYCGPCRQSLPAYQYLLDKYGGKLAVIAVSVDRPADTKAADVMSFAEEQSWEGDA